jgi:hypothetical protein
MKHFTDVDDELLEMVFGNFISCAVAGSIKFRCGRHVV